MYSLSLNSNLKWEDGYRVSITWEPVNRKYNRDSTSEWGRSYCGYRNIEDTNKNKNCDGSSGSCQTLHDTKSSLSEHQSTHDFDRHDRRSKSREINKMVIYAIMIRLWICYFIMQHQINILLFCVLLLYSYFIYLIGILKFTKLLVWFETCLLLLQMCTVFLNHSIYVYWNRKILR